MKWAILDIETTGINPATDEIIDIGFYQFEGVNFIRSFSSLVRPTQPISPFISKLTGITNKQLQKAPMWEEVFTEISELEGHFIIAHNAEFERSFLERYFETLPNVGQGKTVFIDSLPFLALLAPKMSSLSLEQFLVDFKIADSEEHRGLADSRDLLKVLVTVVGKLYQIPQDYQFFQYQLNTLGQDYWWNYFLAFNQDELDSLSRVIDFKVPKIQVSQDPKSLKTVSSVFNPPYAFDSEEIKKILRDEKKIQQIKPHYQYRQSQEEMSLIVGKSFKNEVHALIQAPTGTGKTMGYMIPSMLFANETKETVLVATGTKSLQEQVYQNDLPFCESLFDFKDKFTITRLIGSQNHFCELMFRSDNESDLLEQEFDAKWSRVYFELLFYYNQSVPYEEMLTRENVPYVLKKKNLFLAEKESSLAVDYRSCIGMKCPFAQQCSYMQGLKKAKESKIIIGNHALLMNWPKSLDRPSYVIVDEAHRLEQEATSAYSIILSETGFNQLQKLMNQGMGSLYYLLGGEPNGQDLIQKFREESIHLQSVMADHFQPLKQLIESLFKKSPRYQENYMNELPMIGSAQSMDSLRQSIRHHLESLSFILSSFYEGLQIFQLKWDVQKLKEDENKLKAWSVFENFFTNLDYHQDGLKQLLRPKDLWVATMNYQQDQGYSFNISPIDVGQLIYEQLLVPAKSIVFTSATLANASGDGGERLVEWMTGYHLLTKTRFKRGFYLPPVFDYENRAQVALVTDLPAMSKLEFVTELINKAAPLIHDIQGRTLFLFSSRVRFELGANYLMEKFDGQIPVFIQGMGKNVVEEFKKQEFGILVGMESFGEGIDIPGEQLQFIVIDKVPDIRQDLVINARREYFDQTFGNEFQDYFLAHRARSLHQKFGRLIRTDKDHGAILVADQRLSSWKGSTMKQFLKLMEPYKIQHKKMTEAIDCFRTYFKDKLNQG